MNTGKINSTGVNCCKGGSLSFCIIYKICYAAHKTSHLKILVEFEIPIELAIMCINFTIF